MCACLCTWCEWYLQFDVIASNMTSGVVTKVDIIIDQVRGRHRIGTGDQVRQHVNNWVENTKTWNDRYSGHYSNINNSNK